MCTAKPRIQPRDPLGQVQLARHPTFACTAPTETIWNPAIAGKAVTQHRNKAMADVQKKLQALSESYQGLQAGMQEKHI